MVILLNKIIANSCEKQIAQNNTKTLIGLLSQIFLRHRCTFVHQVLGHLWDIPAKNIIRMIKNIKMGNEDKYLCASF